MSAHALVAVMDATLLEIDIYQQAVLMGLANCAAEDGTNAWPSVETLALRGRMSERKARDALRALEAANIIRPTSLSKGRATTVYALNMGLLAAHKGPVRLSGAGPVDFDAPSPRGGGDRPQPGTPCRVAPRQPGTTRHQPGTPRHSTRHAVPPNLLEPVRTSARDGRDAPSARSPSPASGRAVRDRKPGTDHAAAARGKLDVLDGRSRLWRGLRAALARRRLAALADAWLGPDSIQTSAEGHDRCVILAPFAARKVEDGPLGVALAELGWRVEVSGAGG